MWRIKRLGESPEIVRFLATLVKFLPFGGPEMAAIGDFRPSSRRMITQSTPYVVYTLIYQLQFFVLPCPLWTFGVQEVTQQLDPLRFPRYIIVTTI